MKAIKIFMIMALSSALAGCSDWLSEDGAPKLTYDYYETEWMPPSYLLTAICVGDVAVNALMS